jgi:NAD kinase
MNHSGTTDIDSFPKVLARIYEGRATIMERMRLACTFLDAEDRRVDDCGQLAECGEEGPILLHRVAVC